MTKMRISTNAAFKPFLLAGIIVWLMASCTKEDSNNSLNTVKDIEGNVYQTVTIGTQVWMAENLKTTKYRDGSSIPNVSDHAEWYALNTGAYCEYGNTPSNVAVYGRMYNWYAVSDARNLAPAGWHIPTDAEWNVLTDYLLANGYNCNGSTDGSFYAKSLAATTNWASSYNIGAVGNTDYPEFRNKTGFTALPGGWRGSAGTFYELGYSGYWWSSTEYLSQYGIYRKLDFRYTYMSSQNLSKGAGFSVRCIKD